MLEHLSLLSMPLLKSISYNHQDFLMGQQSCLGTLKENEVSLIRDSISLALKDYDQGKVSDGIEKLFLASTKLDEIHDDKRSDASGKSASNNNTIIDERVIFLHKLAKLWYRLKDYEKCIETLHDPRYNPTGYIPWKIFGDCQRKLGNHQEALDYYKKGYEIAEKQNDKQLMNAILCNEGLLCMELESYQSAVILFQTLLQMESNNILYLCHYGNARIMKGDIFHGMAAFRRAYDLLQDSLEFQSFSQSNKKYIRHEIKEFFNVRQLSRSEQFPFIMVQQNTLHSLRMRLGNALNVGVGTIDDIRLGFRESQRWRQSLDEIIQKRNFINDNTAFKDFFFGMEFTFMSQYNAALEIQKNTSKINIGWILSNLAMMTPVIGGILSKAVDIGNNELLKIQMKRSSFNVLSLSHCIRRQDLNGSQIYYCRLMNEVSTMIIYHYRKALIYYQPSNTIPQWNSFSEIAKMINSSRQQIEVMIYGQSLVSPLYRYGAELMQRVFQTTILNGEIYEGHNPENLSKEVVVNRLVESTHKSLSQDKEFTEVFSKIRQKYP